MWGAVDSAGTAVSRPAATPGGDVFPPQWLTRGGPRCLGAYVRPMAVFWNQEQSSELRRKLLASLTSRAKR